MTDYNIADKIELLINYAKAHLLLQDSDEWYVRNRLLDLLKVEQPSFPTDDVADLHNQILTPITNYAIESGIIEQNQVEAFKIKLIDMVMPCPSLVIEHFDRVCNYEGMRAATNWFYEFGCRSDYIKLNEIKKNIVWSFSGTLGEIIITINLSKPEKDNKDVAAARKMPQSQYPKCMLCPSNVGYSGRENYPPKNNLRTIPIFLNDELWHFQFSPYSYYEQHCIALSDEHKPMLINSFSFERMLEFVNLFPHYFIGSNAPLPIVGGSILTHDHYQGGGKVHPMFKRPVKNQYKHPDFSGVKVGIVDWYNSVIRLKSKNKEALLNALNHIHEFWNNYTDESVNIIANTHEQHNTVTPIIRMERGEIFAEIILRNNRTDKDHPFGIFHPTEDMHHIKREGIGVIEVMGTFILPGRLEDELHNIALYLTGEKPFNEKELSNPDNPLYKHRFMIADLLIKNGIINDQSKVSSIISQHVNSVCKKILMCTAVFKNNAEGKNAFEKFMLAAGFIDQDSFATQALYKQEETEREESINLVEIESVKEYTNEPDNSVTTELEKEVAKSEAPKKRGRPKKIK